MASNSTAGNDPSSDLSETFLFYSRNVFAFFYLFFFLLGLPGNVLLLLVLIRGLRTKSGSHITRLTEPLFINITALDLLFFLYSFPIMFADAIFQGWRLSYWLCISNRSVSFWISFADFYSMLAVSLLRYIAVLHPMHVFPVSQKQIVLTCVFIWVACLLFSTPLWFHYKLVHVEGKTSCVNQMASEELSLYLRLLGGVGFLPPMLLMIFCYSRIISALKLRRRILSIHTVASLHINWRATMMTLVTMVALVTMWLPYWLLIFFTSLDEFLTTVPTYLAYHLTSLLAFTNRCINPVICFFLSSQFQTRLKNLLRWTEKRTWQAGPTHVGKIEILGGPHAAAVS
ncbi:C-C chemokine receptor type 8-like [Tiliqua scincoides]|uniref:C-C chemokine receptor type 8-like n=1 Tax=Tiliqua scincoides TaxID=71010 RepID=UPI0034635A6E